MVKEFLDTFVRQILVGERLAIVILSMHYAFWIVVGVWLVFHLWLSIKKTRKARANVKH